MASRLQDVLLRGTFAARPAATDVAKGTLYYSTDLTTTDQSDGTNWNTYTDGGGGGGGSTGVIRLAAPYIPEQEEVVYEPQIPIPGPVGPAGSAATVRRQITLIIDGAGSAITTGNKGYLSLPVSGTWKKWRLLSIDGTGPATAGSIVIDVWKDTYANYPPTVADTITASAKPTLSAVNKNEDSTLTGWTTTFTAGDILGFNVDSATTVTKVALVLEFE